MEKSKLIEALKKRTVANGCTIEEENEAKKKIKELLNETKEHPIFKAGYGNATTFGEFVDKVEKEDIFNNDLFKKEPPKPPSYKVCPHCGCDEFYLNRYEAKHRCHVICTRCMREYFYSGIVGVNLSPRGNKSVSFKRFKQFGLNLFTLKRKNPTGFVLSRLNSSWFQKILFDIKYYLNLE